MSDKHEALEERYHKLNWQWREYFESSPDRAIVILEEVIEIARTLEEPFWEMEARHWLAQALVFKKRNYQAALPLVVKSAVESRDPQFKTWRTRTCLYQDLIAAHVGADALSHEQTVENALSKMQAEVDPDSQCARCLQGERTTFEMSRGRMAAAEAAAQTYLSMADFPHHRAIAHSHMCHIMFLQQKWQQLAEHAEAALKAAEMPFSENEDVILESLLWQAVAQQQLGNREQAADFFQRSQAQEKLLGITPDPFYFHALTHYHEFDNDIEAAVAVREAHLAAIDGFGALRETAEAQIDLVRLQKINGSLESDAVKRAQTAIAQLKIPGNLPLKLEEILKAA